MMLRSPDSMIRSNTQHNALVRYGLLRLVRISLPAPRSMDSASLLAVTFKRFVVAEFLCLVHNHAQFTRHGRRFRLEICMSQGHTSGMSETERARRL